jgi:hypothetical protein
VHYRKRASNNYDIARIDVLSGIRPKKGEEELHILKVVLQ